MDDFDDFATGTELALREKNPAELGWPPSLPVELALRTGTPQELCASYGIGEDRWDQLRKDPAFQAAVGRYVELLKTEGVSFKLKAQLQSEALLKESWKLIHNPDTPANVRADLIKYTWKCAGHEASKNADANDRPTFAIQINL